MVSEDSGFSRELYPWMDTGRTRVGWPLTLPGAGESMSVFLPMSCDILR